MERKFLSGVILSGNKKEGSFYGVRSGWDAADTSKRPMKDEQKTCSAQLFGEIANSTSRAAGRAPTFVAAVAVVLIWALTGPLFHYSDTWQPVINTGTTIVTFLMVFLIQNSQNRDGRLFRANILNHPTLIWESRFNQIESRSRLIGAVAVVFARLVRRMPTNV